MNIAIIGASANREKFGNRCVRAYVSKGHTVFPINPREKEIEGLKCFSSVKEIPEKISVVSLYLPPENIKGVVDDIIAKKPGMVFFNPGTENAEAEKRLRDAGIDVVKACSIRAIGVDPEKL